MNLENYRIDTKLGNKFIVLNQAAMINLETLLNTTFNDIETLDEYLAELKYLRDNWNTANRDAYVNNKRGGYWDWEIMEENNVTGNWFTLFAFEDIGCSINADTQQVYITDAFNQDRPTLTMSLNDLINIFEQWKNIAS